MELPVRSRGPRLYSLVDLHPLTLADPPTRKVQAGPPVKRTVIGPLPSTFTELLTLAATVAVPSAPIAASFTARFAASRLETPRTTAVTLSARPDSLALVEAVHHGV